MPVIASGGVGSLDDIRKLRALGRRNLDAVIVGRAHLHRRASISRPRSASATATRGAERACSRQAQCIPVPRRQGRARGEGRQLRRAPRRRRPGRGRDPLRPRRGRRAHLPRHHRLARGAADHPRRGVAHRRARLHAADGRRRRPRARRHPGASATPAPTRCRSTPRRWRGPSSSTRRRSASAASASWWRSTPSACRHRRRKRRASRSTRTAAAAPTGLDAIEWAVRMERAGAGEILLTSMDRDGTQEGYDIALTRAVSRAVAHSGHRLGRRRHARAPLRRPHGR